MQLIKSFFLNFDYTQFGIYAMVAVCLGVGSYILVEAIIAVMRYKKLEKLKSLYLFFISFLALGVGAFFLSASMEYNNYKYLVHGY